MPAARREITIEDYIERFKMRSFLNDEMTAHLRVFHFPAFSQVMTQQDEQTHLYFLVEGQVQCTHYHPNGKMAVLAFSQPFAAIGDVEILTGEPYKTDVTTTQPVTMLGLSSHIVEKHGADDPRFLRFLVDQLRHKLYASNAVQSGQVFPVMARLALYLISQPRYLGNMVILPEKTSLAALLGTTTRHLNRVLRDLSDENVISEGYPGVRLLDIDRLQGIIEE